MVPVTEPPVLHIAQSIPCGEQPRQAGVAFSISGEQAVCFPKTHPQCCPAEGLGTSAVDGALSRMDSKLRLQVGEHIPGNTVGTIGDNIPQAITPELWSSVSTARFGMWRCHRWRISGSPLCHRVWHPFLTVMGIYKLLAQNLRPGSVGHGLAIAGELHQRRITRRLIATSTYTENCGL